MPGPPKSLRGPHIPEGEGMAGGKPTLDNLPLLRFGMLPSKVIEQVKKLVKRLSKVKEKHVWLERYLIDAKFNHISFEPVFERPDRAKEMRHLHRAPSDFGTKHAHLFPKLSPCETRQYQALKWVAMHSETHLWMEDKAWSYLEDNFTEVNGGCWVANETACYDYPFGFRSKEYPMKHVTTDVDDVDIAYKVFSMIVCGYGDFVQYCTMNHARPGYLRWDISHLCGHSHCVRPSHLVIELHLENLARQLCEGNERCRCGDNLGTPGYGFRCLGHRSCPDNCPERVRRLIKLQQKLMGWKKWIRDKKIRDKKIHDKKIHDKKIREKPPSILRHRVTKTRDYALRLRDALEAAEAARRKAEEME